MGCSLRPGVRPLPRRCAGAGGCPGCPHGSGKANCTPRTCAAERGLDGCWQCDEFPCGRGMFGNEEWRGLSIASVECIKEHGLEGYVAILTSRYGDVVQFEPFQSRSPQEARMLLCGGAEI